MLTYRQALSQVNRTNALSHAEIRQHLAEGIPPLTDLEQAFERVMSLLRGEGDFGGEGEMLRQWQRDESTGFDQLRNLLTELDAGNSPPPTCLWNAIDAAEGGPKPRRLVFRFSTDDSGRLSLWAVILEAEIIDHLPNDVVELGLLVTLVGAVTGRPLGNLTLSVERTYLAPENSTKAKLELATPRQPVRFSVRNAGRGLNGLLAISWRDLEVVS